MEFNKLQYDCKLIFIYLNGYSIKLISINCRLVYDEATNTITNNFARPDVYNNIFINFYKKFMRSLTQYFLKKIKFKGKSYKIEKHERVRNCYRFKIGKATRVITIIYLDCVHEKFVKKTKFFVFFTNFSESNLFFAKIILLRP